MRIFHFYLLCTLSIILFSCSKENEKPFDETLIIGSWKMVSVNYTGQSTTSYAGITTTANYTGTGIDMDLTLNFSENPNSFISEGSYSIELNIEVLGQVTTSVTQIEDLMMPGTWSIKGDILKIQSMNDTQEATIKKLNASEMVVVGSIDDSQSINGVTVTQKVTSTFIFEKL
jgi:hypothetical protein